MWRGCNGIGFDSYRWERGGVIVLSENLPEQYRKEFFGGVRGSSRGTSSFSLV